MLGLMEKLLESKNIPHGYALCFNEGCQLREKCLHYQAYLLKPEDRLGGPAIYPDAWKSGQCQRFNEAKLAILAEAVDLTTAIIMVTTSSRPVSRQTSWPFWPNTAAPTVWPSTITKRLGISTDDKSVWRAS